MVDFDLGHSSPDQDLPNEGFSARLERCVDFSAASYSFSVQADDGVRVWVGDELLADRWDGPAGTDDAIVDLDAGSHCLRLEYNDISGPASLQFNWELAPTPTPTATVTPASTATPTPTATPTLTPTPTATSVSWEVHLPLGLK